jgi:hypothetical protein
MFKLLQQFFLFTALIFSMVNQCYAWSIVKEKITIDALTLEKIIPKFYLKYNYEFDNFKNNYNGGKSYIHNSDPPKLIELYKIKKDRIYKRGMKYDVIIHSYDITNGKVERSTACNHVRTLEFIQRKYKKEFEFITSNLELKNCDEI